jgi:uncharacterized membrane protein (DUF106 family)
MTKGKLKQLRKQLKRLRERKRLQGSDKNRKESKQLKERKSRLMLLQLPLLNQLLKMLFRKLMTTSQVTIGLFMAITLRLASHC